MSHRRLLFALVGGAVLVGVVMVAGGYNVAASSGHLPPVRALLHWTMHNSVTLRAGHSPPQDLASHARVLAGAGQYDLVCRNCHGAPGEPVDAVARSLVPPAPHIGDVVGGWQPRELFWIVKHGIKMTAMPAWPSQHRDDEVWSMVAFLLALRDMSPETYRRMVAGPDDAPGSVDPDFHTQLARCARCHGYDGRGNGARALPRIDGLSQVYLHDALRAYAAGERASGVMQSQASMVPARYLPGLARHFSRAGEDRGSDLPPTGDAVWSDEEPGGASRGSNASASWGRTVALQGIPQRRVPACAGCHGPASYPRAPAYPPLAGQPAAYLATQLRLFRDGHRGGSAFADVMVHAASELDDGDIDAVAGYYARRAPGRR